MGDLREELSDLIFRTDEGKTHGEIAYSKADAILDKYYVIPKSSGKNE